MIAALYDPAALYSNATMIDLTLPLLSNFHYYYIFLAVTQLSSQL
ncbi:MAG: hypothetical protein ACI9W6_002954 [Motiliproteus sp.]|jgi:hypothetical protein